jgi:DHA3 family macrolide efflux protein-like MFS transporter
VQFALIWYLTVLTGSATALATAALVGMLPNLALGPFIGALVDRWYRRQVMLAADSIVALATVALAVLFTAVFNSWLFLVVLSLTELWYNPSHKQGNGRGCNAEGIPGLEDGRRAGRPRTHC